MVNVMKRSGHYGIALLAYAPIGLFIAALGYGPLALLGGLCAISLSTIPDCDRQLPGIDHRGPTHSVVFVLLVSAALASVCALVLSSPSPFFHVGFVALAFAIGAVSVGSHLLADALTPTGITPFWPLSNRRYAISVSYGTQKQVNYMLLGSGIVASLAVVVSAVALF